MTRNRSRRRTSCLNARETLPAELSALEGVRPAGTVVFCGENYRELKIVPSYQIIHREVTLTGAFYYTRQDFYDLCEIYYRGFDPRAACEPYLSAGGSAGSLQDVFSEERQRKSC